MAKTVVFDFDGVIHNYCNGWTAPHGILENNKQRKERYNESGC